MDIDVEQCGSMRQVTEAVSTSLKRQGYRSSVEFTEVAGPIDTLMLPQKNHHKPLPSVCVAFSLEPFSSG